MKTFAIKLIKSIFRHNVGTLAAVLAYFGFSALVPLLALLVYTASFFAPEPAVQTFLVGVLQSWFPAIPAEHAFAVATLSRLVRLGTTITIVGIVSLLWSAVGGFVNLQQILDKIYESHHKRSFFRQYVAGFIMLAGLLAITILSTLLSLVSPAVIAKVMDVITVGAVRQWTVLATSIAAVVTTISHVMFLVALFVSCYVALRILPSRVLRPLSILAGATVATGVIYLSRYLFVFYSHHLGRYQLMYGTLTFVMLLTFWIYIACIIFLVAAEFAVAIDSVVSARQPIRHYQPARHNTLADNETANSSTEPRPPFGRRRVKRP